MVNDLQIDALKEFVNIGIGKAADVLNAMLESPVELKAIDVFVLDKNQIDEILTSEDNTRLSIVGMEYFGSIEGTSFLVMEKADSLKMVKLLVGDMVFDGKDELDAIRTGTLAEIGNIILNSILGMISNILDMELSYTVPHYTEETLASLYKSFFQSEKYSRTVVKIRSNFLVKKKSINGSILIVFDELTFTEITNHIDKLLGEQS